MNALCMELGCKVYASTDETASRFAIRFCSATILWNSCFSSYFLRYSSINSAYGFVYSVAFQSFSNSANTEFTISPWLVDTSFVFHSIFRVNASCVRFELPIMKRYSSLFWKIYPLVWKPFPARCVWYMRSSMLDKPAMVSNATGSLKLR